MFVSTAACLAMCLLALPFRPAFGEANLSIWNTNSRTNTFCEHLTNSQTGRYQFWFSHLANQIRENIDGISHHQITNIFLQKPAILHCNPFYINLIIETSYNPPTLRDDLQHWVRTLKLKTTRDFNVMLKIFPMGEITPPRQGNLGIYIVQNQLVNHYYMTQTEIHHVMETARRCRLHVTRMWKDNERVYIRIRNSNVAMVERFRQNLPAEFMPLSVVMIENQ